jgi:hypothetical protein
MIRANLRRDILILSVTATTPRFKCWEVAHDHLRLHSLTRLHGRETLYSVSARYLMH